MKKKVRNVNERRLSARDGYLLEVDDHTSERMANIRQKGTKPELIVRQVLRLIGVRYRVSNRDLPGSPDVANRRRKWAVFVHGCFWHRHQGCPKATTPKRNQEFWLTKFARNQERDSSNVDKLETMGFKVVTVWECETNDPQQLARRLAAELGNLPGS